ncbi:MAG: hypothetical protein AAF495_12715 [Pseudomonadota bacterium]
MTPFTLYATFHGGSDKSDWNNIHAFTDQGATADPSKVLDKDTLPDGVQLRELRAMTWGPDGNLYVVNAYKDYSQVLCFHGALQENWRHGFGAVFTSVPGTHPFQCLFGPDGYLYVANQDTRDVRRYYGPSSTGGTPGQPVESGDGVFLDGFNAVRGIAFNDRSNQIFVADETAPDPDKAEGKIDIYDLGTGTSCGTVPDPDGHLHEPVHLVFHKGILTIGDSKNDNLLYYDPSAGESARVKVYVHKDEAQLDAPSGLLFAPDSLLYVASRKGQQINQFAPAADGHSATFEQVFVTSTQLKDNPEFLLAASLDGGPIKQSAG